MNESGSHQVSYIPALDGLRGLAILFVIGVHAQVPGMRGGVIGVDIFFVLSGFLITTLLVKEYNVAHRISLKNFYMRRILRLIPALVLMLSTFTVLSLFRIGSDDTKHTFAYALIALFYMSNWYTALSHEPGLFLHTWSLSIEEQFYILWPIAFIMLMRLRTPKIAWITLVMGCISWMLSAYMASSGSSVARVYNGLDTRAVAILFGCTLALVLSNQPLLYQALSKIVCRYSRCLVVVIIIFFGWILLYVDDESPKYFWLLGMIALSACALIVDVLMSKSSPIRPLLESRALVGLGRMSYGVYLWHFPIFWVLQRYGASWYVTLVIGSILTFIIAWLSFRFVEQPILKLKIHFPSASLPAPTLKSIGN